MIDFAIHIYSVFMRRTWEHRHLFTRRFVAAAVLCLFALKGVSMMGIVAELAAAPSIHKEAISSIVLGTHCDHSNSKHAPSGSHGDHEDCCAFCTSSAKKFTALDPVINANIIDILTPHTQAGTPILFSEDSIRSQMLGWVTSWSSTSPPSA